MINIKKALLDILNSIKLSELWFSMAALEIKQRYRRSALGPLWITLSMAITLLVMGPLYSMLFQQEIRTYLLNLTIGMVIWTFISGCLNDFCQIYINSANLIKQIKIPYSLYIFKVIAKNLIIFFHNFILILIVLAIYPTNNFLISLISLFGLFLVVLNLLWLGLLTSLICTRFRDMNQLIGNVLQIIFFITPIVWTPSSLGSKQFLLNFNFFYHLIEVIRLPLLGLTPSLITWIFLIACPLIGYPLVIILFSRYRSRISFWV